MESTGCLTQLIRPILYLYCFAVVVLNIGMISLPILKLQIAPGEAEHGFFKMVNQMPYFVAFIFSLVGLSELPTKKWTNFLSPYAAILNLLIIS